MRALLAVGLGGFLGAIARYGASTWIHRHLGTAFPWATLAVNVVGCAALGALMMLVELRPELDPRVRLVVGIGLLGSMTTFSTFAYETVDLLRRAEPGAAIAYAAGSVVVGLVAVVGGAWCVRWLAL